MIKKLLSAIFLLCFPVVAAFAQSNPEQAVINARDQFFEIKKRSIEIERIKRDASKKPASVDSSPNFPKIKDDFEQIQKLNDKIFQLIEVKALINHAAVLELVSEINERATRLRSNLFSDESEEKKEKNKPQNTNGTEELKKLLNSLDKAINRFVHNPIFQNLKLVNLEESNKAQNDLESVIKISSVIKEKGKIK